MVAIVVTILWGVIRIFIPRDNPPQNILTNETVLRYCGYNDCPTLTNDKIEYMRDNLNSEYNP